MISYYIGLWIVLGIEPANGLWWGIGWWGGVVICGVLLGWGCREGEMMGVA